MPPGLRGIVSRLLRSGLLLAAALLLIGCLGYLARGEGLGPTRTAVGWDGGLVGSIAAGDPAVFVLLGVAVLLATPLLRVAVSVGLFAASGDRAFTALTLFVLLLLAATVIVGVIR